MQNAEGRGPWKPGFSDTWLDQDRQDYSAPSVIEDFGWDKLREVQSYAHCGFHCGCGCSSFEQLDRWFTPTEKKRLEGFGYQIVSFVPTKIIAKSEWQVLFAHRTPLKKLRPLPATALTTP